MKLQSYAAGAWVTGTGRGRPLLNAVNGEVVAEANSEGVDFAGMLEHARSVGGPNLRRMTFHERARMLKALAKHLTAHKGALYRRSAATGATKADSWIDIDGGIGTLFVYASKGRREFPDETFYVDGGPEAISKRGSFLGQHLCVPLEGVAVHINAFNFPCWGVLEKLAPTLLAGVPAIVKPATITSYLSEQLVRLMLDAAVLPDGALQLICGSVGDLLDHLTGQDVVTLTGSASTGQRLRAKPSIVNHAVRFNMEADSLNCCILGPACEPGTPEFDLFVNEVSREMTVKAGQKCTAIRRAIVPDRLSGVAIEALSMRLSKIPLGDPAEKGVRMGPLAGLEQVQEVGQRVAEIRQDAELVYGDTDDFAVVGGDRDKGAFSPALLLYTKEPFKHRAAHDVEAFGPVCTVMPYGTVEDAIELAKLGKGSLVGSLFTNDDEVARQVVLGTAAYHGRIMIVNRACAEESTGHGSPLPHLIHGGPGRAGGGEEMGGVRGVMHYLQRSALQGSPTTLSRICNRFMRGAATTPSEIHPFRQPYEDLAIGRTFLTARRTIGEADIVNFAGVSGDYFYAHMDELAARSSIFEKRVAHGYFIVSAAAGLFVDPAEGPVLANYGLENLRFVKPVYAGDTIRVRLTVKQKTVKERRQPDDTPQGVVEWDVEVLNQNDESVAVYSILTLVRCREATPLAE
ncbi:MAG: phenylacetic acid degradation bifunctional protein PaaZ [Proteobacteria bacterium]|nr:phenylacetic acid degradation bifunctional protein PaaZ [Pseudomonadota bacterium]